MLIVLYDPKGLVDEDMRETLLSDLRSAGFWAIPMGVITKNGLVYATDCIGTYLGAGLSRFIVAGDFPDVLVIIAFSAKEQYIPHDPAIISAVSAAVSETMRVSHFLKSETKAAVWVTPIPLGLWNEIVVE